MSTNNGGSREVRSEMELLVARELNRMKIINGVIAKYKEDRKKELRRHDENGCPEIGVAAQRLVARKERSD